MIYEIKNYIDKPDIKNAKKMIAQYHLLKHATAQYINTMKKLGHTLDGSGGRLRNMQMELNEMKKRAIRYMETKMDRELIRNMNGNILRVTLPFDRTKYPDALKRMRKQVRMFRSDRKMIYDKITMRKPGQFMLEVMSKYLGEPKSPKTNDKYVGIEIECVMPYNADIKQLAKFYKWVTVGSDGSVQYGPGEEGREIRVCMKQSEVRTILPQILDTLKQLGASVNKSCGLHVHLDQRHNEHPERTFNNLVRSLKLLYKIVPASRRRNNYCNKNNDTSFGDSRARGDRYLAINPMSYNKYSTIEVRLFGGTLEFNKIANWTEILWGIAESEMFLRCPPGWEAAKKKWNLSDENIAWLVTREELFKGLNTPHESEMEAQPVTTGNQLAVTAAF